MRHGDVGHRGTESRRNAFSHQPRRSRSTPSQSAGSGRRRGHPRRGDVGHRGTESRRRVGGRRGLLRRPACVVGSDRCTSQYHIRIGSCTDPSPTARVASRRRRPEARALAQRTETRSLRVARGFSLCLCASVTTVFFVACAARQTSRCGNSSRGSDSTLREP
jgi:hypothetical protein